MRRAGPRRRAADLLEQNAFLRQAVESRSLSVVVAVGAEAVRSQRVDGDQQDIRQRGGGLKGGEGDCAEREKGGQRADVGEGSESRPTRSDEEQTCGRDRDDRDRSRRQRPGDLFCAQEADAQRHGERQQVQAGEMSDPQLDAKSMGRRFDGLQCGEPEEQGAEHDDDRVGQRQAAKETDGSDADRGGECTADRARQHRRSRFPRVPSKSAPQERDDPSQSGVGDAAVQGQQQSGFDRQIARREADPRSIRRDPEPSR